MRNWFLIFVTSLISIAVMAQSSDAKSTGIFYAIRLTPHQDLKKEISEFAKRNKIKAGFIATCVGSLEHVSLRFANQDNGSSLKGHFEIVSLTGTFSDSSSHIHLAVSDSTGNTIGGHLLDGSLVYTTAEIVIGELSELEFSRTFDTTYHYNELSVKPKKQRRK